MENFIVSARKYRPQTFDTVIGQGPITNTLKNAIRSNHLAQAFLFCGPRGVGKTTCARILAKTINCYNISENIEACNHCESCTSFNNNASFNIHELDAASNNSVDDIRNLVEQVRIPPQVGRYKVYIIDEVHMLSQAAFNAFLKTLEEPPAYAKFILATTEKHKIIPTILSRCQIYDFRRITVEDIAGHLAYVAEKENVKAETDALHIIAQKSDGALRDALSIFDQIISYSGKNITYKNVIENLNVLDYDYFFKIVEAINSGDIINTLLLINEIIDNGFDGQHFLIGFGEHLRNLLVGKDSDTLNLLEVGGSIRDKYLDQSKQCSVDFLLRALAINNKCDVDYKSSNNKKLHLELALMQMCRLNAVSGNSEISTALPPERKVKSSGKPQQPVKKEATTGESTKPVKASTGKVTTPVTTSIRGLRNDSGSDQPKKDEEENLTDKPVEKFDRSDLIKAWDQLKENFKPDPNFFTTLNNNQPELKENFNISFEVLNKIQKNEIEDKKLEILPFLREKLKNYKVQLEITVADNNVTKKPYTPQEKFSKMAEKNPALKTLKDRLDLEIDF